MAIASAAALSSAVIRAICSSGLSPGLRCNCSADTPTGEPAGGSGIPPAAAHDGARALHGLHNLLGRLVHEIVIE